MLSILGVARDQVWYKQSPFYNIKLNFFLLISKIKDDFF